MKLFNLPGLFHNIKIKYKLFFAYFLVTIIPVSAIGYFSYISSVSYIEDQILDVTYQFQQNTILTTEKRMDNYMFLSNTIYDNQKIQKFVSGEYNDYYEEFDMVDSFIKPVLQSLLNATGKGIYVALIRYNNTKSEILQTNYENIISNYGQSRDYLKAKSQVYNVINYDSIKNKVWLKENMGKVGQYTWKQVGDDGKYNYISLMKEMVQYSDDQREKIGMLRITVRLADILLEEKISEASEKGFNLVFDNNHSLLSVETEKGDFFNKNRENICNLLSQQNGEKSLIVDDVILIRGNISSEGWNIVSVFPIAKLTEKVRAIRNMTILYCMLSVIFLLAVTFLISASFSGRIIAVTKQMQKFKKGNLTVRVKEVNKDELGFLASVFNDMTEKIETLIKDNYQANIDKKDAQLIALQAQINPHFLYNSMSSISRLAEIGETNDIINMVRALVKFYRMTLNKGREIISIADEIEQIKAYLEVYRIRKGEFFNVVYNINEDILGYKTVKVILQPFVENIFEHAFSISEYPINIIIVAEKNKEDIVFKIIDDGVGISRVKFKALFSEVEISSKSGYGIRNVDERIKLQFGKEYGVTIHSIYGAGTTVIVTIPQYLP